MSGRAWTQTDIAALYKYASRISQADAARRLKRTAIAVSIKASRMGIVWRQGSYSTQQVATEVGCSQTAVVRLLRILFEPDEVRTRQAGGGRRYYLTEAQYTRLVDVLSRTRKYRKQYIFAAQCRHRGRM